jgi:hypothetical protein
MRTSSFRILVLAMIVLGLSSAMSGATARQEEPPPAASPRTAQVPQSLTVEIACPEHFHRRVLAPEQGFLVVVTNTSKEPVRVWRDWCSWGYQQLTFEITDDAGKSWVIRRKDHGFFKNYPDFWTLGAGEPLVLSIALKADLWESDRAGDSLPVADLKGKAVTIRALFAAAEDDASRENKVWTGKIASAPRVYELE